MTDDRGPGAADVLHERKFCTEDLVGAGRARKLQVSFDDLINAGCADGMSACLEAAHRRERQVALDADASFQAESRTGALFGEPGRLQRHPEDEAREHRFASVCVNTTWVSLAKALLAGSDVMVCCVVGFPLGAMSPGAKAYEARDAVRHGASEVDMVMNIGAMKSRDYETVFEDICKVVKASRPAGVKVILETSSLTDEENIIGCTLSKPPGAAFVKTSTGFAKGGATVEDVALMRRVVGDRMGVKASGGIRSTEDAEAMIKHGASRIGASASVAIVKGLTSDADY